MKNKRKKKTVRFVPLTRKEPLSQRTVLELLSGSESTQLVKTSTPARVEVDSVGGEASGKSRGNSFSGIVD